MPRKKQKDSVDIESKITDEILTRNNLSKYNVVSKRAECDATPT